LLRSLIGDNWMRSSLVHDDTRLRETDVRFANLFHVGSVDDPAPFFDLYASLHHFS
jgi:hypothetical protein